MFLALFVGLWCPFCRRQIAADGDERGQAEGARGRDARDRGHAARERPALLQVPPDPRCAWPPIPELSHPPRLRLAEAGADARSSWRRSETTRINPDRRVARSRADRGGGRRPSPSSTATPRTETDQADMERQWPQLKGQFLIDRDGIVRWANIECAEGFAGVGKFPSEEEILAAARALPR